MLVQIFRGSNDHRTPENDESFPNVTPVSAVKLKRMCVSVVHDLLRPLLSLVGPAVLIDGL